MASEEFKELSEKLDRIELGVLLRSKDVLTVSECALLTGLTVKGVYRHTSERTIPFYKPIGGRVYFRKDEIERWMLRNRQPMTTEVESEAATRAFLTRDKGVGTRATASK